MNAPFDIDRECERMRYRIWAMPFRPALLMNRANLRCLGLSVGIAIALSSCGIGPDLTGYEASDNAYATVLTIADAEWGSTPMARKALADGRLTESEYRQIMARFDADRAAELAQRKADALRRWGRTGQSERTGA